MRARNYDPQTGQFLSNDPLGLAGGDFNVRRYVTNDPVSSNDPVGLAHAEATDPDAIFWNDETGQWEWYWPKRLKVTLIQWLRELLAGRYDQEYVARRWQVGWRHVEIGLEQVYTNAALSRIRLGLRRALHENWRGELKELQDTVRSLNKLLDLDLAIIEDAYQFEYAARLQRSELFDSLADLKGSIRNSLCSFQTVRARVKTLLNGRSKRTASRTAS